MWIQSVKFFFFSFCYPSICTLGLLSRIFLSFFSMKTLYGFHISPIMCHMSLASHPPLLDHMNSGWWWQIPKFLMKLTAFSTLFLNTHSLCSFFPQRHNSQSYGFMLLVYNLLNGTFNSAYCIVWCVQISQSAKFLSAVQGTLLCIYHSFGLHKYCVLSLWEYRVLQDIFVLQGDPQGEDRCRIMWNYKTLGLLSLNNTSQRKAVSG